MLNKRIVVTKRASKRIKNNVNTSRSSEFKSRDKVSVVTDKNDLIYQFVVSKSGYVNADLHVHTLLGKVQLKIGERQVASRYSTSTDFLYSVIIQRVNRVLNIQYAEAKCKFPLFL